MFSKLLFSLKNRPRLEPGIAEKKSEANLVISADFELGWAFRYSRKNNRPEEMADRARRNFPFLIKLFEEYNIKITWATVGHLFLRECKKGDHDWMHRIPFFTNKNWVFSKGDWFDCDPYSSIRDDKTWYAPDLIEKILNSRVEHEVGCHSFSHIDFSDKNCPRKVAEDEIKACIEVAKQWDINLKSFVFPGGTYGNYQTLKEFGFTNYRKILDYELMQPVIDENGLVIIPVSTGLGNNGLGWTKEYFFKRLKKYIDKAVENGTVCHFWFHPSIDEWFLHNVFPEILKYTSEKREEGKLRILTMTEIAKRVLKKNNKYQSSLHQQR